VITLYYFISCSNPAAKFGWTHDSWSRRFQASSYQRSAGIPNREGMCCLSISHNLDPRLSLAFLVSPRWQKPDIKVYFHAIKVNQCHMRAKTSGGLSSSVSWAMKGYITLLLSSHLNFTFDPIFCATSVRAIEKILNCCQSKAMIVVGSKFSWISCVMTEIH